MLVDNEALQNYWYVVAESRDLATAPAAVRLLERDYVIWRSRDGNVVARFCRMSR